MTQEMALTGSFVTKLRAIRAWWCATVESAAAAERLVWPAPVVWEPATVLIDAVLQQPVIEPEPDIVAIAAEVGAGEGNG